MLENLVQCDPFVMILDEAAAYKVLALPGYVLPALEIETQREFFGEFNRVLRFLVVERQGTTNKGEGDTAKAPHITLVRIGFFF
jgi:hypothetical protein